MLLVFSECLERMKEKVDENKDQARADTERVRAEQVMTCYEYVLFYDTVIH